MYRQLGFPFCFLFDHLTGVTLSGFFYEMSLKGRNMGDSWSLAKPAWQSPWASPWGEEVEDSPQLFPFAWGCYSCFCLSPFLGTMLVFLFLHAFIHLHLQISGTKELGASRTLSSLSHRATGFTTVSFFCERWPKRCLFYWSFQRLLSGRSPPMSMCLVSLLWVCFRCVNWYSHPRVSLPIDAVVNFR